jgi:hypothetical protein
MASNQHLQSLLRKFKTVSKEHSDKNKLINSYTHKLNIEDTLDISLLYQSNNDIYIYELDFTSEPTEPISWYDYPIEDTSDMHITSYIDTGDDGCLKGYLTNVFNAEICNEAWVINVFMMHKIYANFITDIVKINSLHIGDILSLSAYNHYLLNSTQPILKNSEYNWTNVSTDKYSDLEEQRQICKKKYKSQILNLLEPHIHSPNNINYIINETKYKLNFITVDTIDTDYKSHISYALFIIKLLDMNGIFMVKIPHIKDTQFGNILLLYSLIFHEVYIFKFDLITQSSYLLCKNKKKISNESVYKKLMHILMSMTDTSAHLFSKKIFEKDNIKSWLKNVIKIANIEDFSLNSIKFDAILSIINDNLGINTETFL